MESPQHFMTSAHSSTFEKIFRENYSRLYAYAFSILQSEEDSRDAVDEAFIDAWRHRGNISEGKTESYIFMCLRNTCLTQVRRRVSSRLLTEDVLLRLAAETDEQWREREERISRIEQTIGTLPERTRYVLEQCYYERRTYRDVAQQLGITTDGVKKHITTALKALRATFNIDKHKT